MNGKGAVGPMLARAGAAFNRVQAFPRPKKKPGHRMRAMTGLPPLQGGCGVSTVRVTPRATTQPCVYWPGSGEPLSDLVSVGSEILNSVPFEQARTLPGACRPCELRDACHGGCAGRRRLQGTLLQPDSYCPIIRGERPRLEIRMAANRDLPKVGSSCTTVVIARESDS